MTSTNSTTRLRVVPAAGEPDTEIPPHDLEAEAAVLSSAIIDSSAIAKVIDFLRPEHFFPESHRRIFEACVALFQAKEPVDTHTVGSWLLARGRLVQIGGVDYLAKLVELTPRYLNVRSHAAAVHDMWRRRKVIAACQKITAQGYVSVPDVQQWCDEAQKAIGLVAMQNPTKPVESNEQVLATIMQEWIAEQAAAGQASLAEPVVLSGYPTGLFGIDRIVGGLQKGAKTTIAATTGVGKTAFAIQLAVAAARQGLGVLYFAMEMNRKQLMRRAVIHEARVSNERVKFKRLTPNDKIELAHAARRLNTLPLRVEETPDPTIEQVAAIARTVQEQMQFVDRVPLGMIVLDYVQRLRPSFEADEHRQIHHSTKQFKILCQKLDVVGIELAQAKDLQKGKKAEKPRASTGIAGTTQIAKESDDVIFLWPEDDPHNDPRQSVIAIVAKQREGRKGEVALMFRRDIYRFVDPNAPQSFSNPSRQYVDDNPLTEGL